MNHDLYWLALRRVRGVGPSKARVLLERFKSASGVFAASENELVEAGVYRTVARNIKEFSDFAPLERELCEIARIGASMVRWTDDFYPPNLREIADPPPVLFARGALKLGERKCVAIVGARIASEGGLRMAHRLGLELAARGFSVVSGLARGIDGQAHQGALDAAGRTIAVMGCGIDVIYPAEHRRLTEAIIDNSGVLLSELPMGTPPIAENFPGRNRILSGLCMGVIVVEAAERSGSLITARMAVEQNRQVFAVPGSPAMGRARGSNRLIKSGAVLVECVEDVIEELAPQFGEANIRRNIESSAPPGHTADSVGTVDKIGEAYCDDNTILKYLKQDEKLHIDSIIEASGLSPQIVLRLLLEFELRGMVIQHPGKLFSLARV